MRPCVFIALLLAACAPPRSSLEAAIADLKEERFDRAVPALQAEASKGNLIARRLLAKLYASGLGVERDDVRAEHYFTCERIYGCISGEAEYFLAIDFIEGAGIPQDRLRGLQWMRDARDKGYQPASDWLEKDARR